MIIKIYRKRDKNKKRRRRRGLTLIRIVLCHNENFRGARPKMKRNGKNRKNRARSDTVIIVP
jgi:hypothetical protein